MVATRNNVNAFMGFPHAVLEDDDAMVANV